MLIYCFKNILHCITSQLTNNNHLIFHNAKKTYYRYILTALFNYNIKEVENETQIIGSNNSINLN
jgi:hypothetical protein